MHPIQSVAIVGAGNMGSGIAQKSAQEEFDVQMVDREQQWVDRGQGIISDFLSEAVERRIFSPQQVEEIKKDWYIINAFVRKGATFMTNWGMTEIGPCAINTVFDSIDKVEEYRSKIVHGIDGQISYPLLGDRFYCDYRIAN